MINYSENGRLALGAGDTLQSMVGSLGRHGERTALTVLHRQDLESWTYTELADHVHRFAAGLVAEGLKQGDRAVLFAPNSTPWIVACLALLEIGAIPVPVDVQALREDLAHILQDSAATWAFVTDELTHRLAQAQPAHVPRVILLDQESEKNSCHWRRFLAKGRTELPAVSPDDCAVLFYTSGTTGLPKGVPLSHGNLTSNIATLLSLEIAHADDCLLLPLPLHHVYPFVVGLLSPLALGAAIVVPYSMTGIHIERAVGEGRATAILGVPRLYSALYNAIERQIGTRSRPVSVLFHAMFAFSVGVRRIIGVNIGRWLFAPLRRHFAPDVRLVISGGAALEPALAWKLEGLGWQVVTGYGLTETSPILTFTLPGARRLDNAGRPLPGIELRIATPEPPAQRGEVLAKGPSVFSCYRHLPEESAQAFTTDGWFRTGDLGHFDHKGYLHLDGRASAMIVLPGGTNVDPEEVEAALEGGRYIREAGVLEKDGRLRALVVPDPSAARGLNPVQLQQVVREEVRVRSRALASYQRVSKILIDAMPLPRTRLGKLRRYKLDRRYEQLEGVSGATQIPAGAVSIETLALEDRELLEDPTAKQVWAWLGERYANQMLTPDTSFRIDLDVDSMEWLSLALEIRDRTGIHLDDDAIGRIETVRDLLRESIGAQFVTEAGTDPETQLRQPEALLSEGQRRWLQPTGIVARTFTQLLYVILRALMRGLFHLEVTGEAHLPATGPCIITANHQSLLDPIAIAMALGTRRLRHTCWGGWTGIMFNSRLKRTFSRAMRVLPVDLGKGPLSNLALGVAALQQGCNLVWFPEGERSSSGTLQPFRTGIGLLVRAQTVPIVPVWIEGSGQALPVGGYWPRRRAISVRVGAILDAKILERQGKGIQPHERIANALHDEVARLQPQGTMASADSILPTQ